MQAWRGTSREYADAGGSDLAHKLAAVCGNVFKLLAKGDERAPGREGITCGTAANVAKERATRQRRKGRPRTRARTRCRTRSRGG